MAQMIMEQEDASILQVHESYGHFCEMIWKSNRHQRFALC